MPTRTHPRLRTTRLHHRSVLGNPWLDVPHLNGARSIILATSGWGGLRPFLIRLPHQVYLGDALTWLATREATELWALPVGVQGRWVQLIGPAPGTTHPRTETEHA